ncbi:efflux RND transporter periplasmic adaptor subunit [Methylomonas sp. MgM2]
MSENNSVLSSNKWLMPSVAIGSLLLIILFSLGFLGGPDKVEPGTVESTGQNLPAGAQTVQVTAQTAADAVSWQGTVRSRTVAKIAPKLNARVMEVRVYAGDKVKKGQVLAKLDDRDLLAAYNAASAALVAAKAQAAQANADEKRTIDLFRKEAATKQNYDAVLAQAKSARAMVSQAASSAQQAKVMLGENLLQAPFDGVISERLKEPGDMAMPGDPVVLMYNPNDLRFESAIASHCFEQVDLKTPVKVRVDALHESFDAMVDEIAPDIDPQTHTRLIKVDLPPAAGLQHGQFGWLELSCHARRQVILIPATAVIHYGQLQAVKVVEGQRVHTRHIRTGKQHGEQVEVLSGLHDGEIILRSTGLTQ